LQKKLERIRKEVYPASKEGFQKWSRDALNTFKLRRLSGKPGLHPRTGDLRRSFRQRVRGTQLQDLEARFTTRSKYARIHEEGGKVVPVNAKMLAIPFPDGPALTPAGAGRYASPLRQSLPADVSFFTKKVAGVLFLFGRKEGGEVEPWYILKKQVRIKPRLGFERSLRHDHKRLMASLRRRYKNIFEKGRPG
jgi:phage gpG-like protein